jgi:hypothetical protein
MQNGAAALFVPFSESAREELDPPLLNSAARSITASRRLKNGFCRKSKPKFAALSEHKKTRQIAENLTGNMVILKPSFL